MKKKRRVLWIDDQINQIGPWSEALTAADWEVAVERTHYGAEQTLRKDQQGFDLIICDIMTPTKTEEEEQDYPPEKTDRSLTAGLHFYTRNKDLLNSTKTPVLVCTQRIDQDVLEKFEEAGLPKGHFATKFVLGRIDDFFQKIEQVTGLPRYSH